MADQASSPTDLAGETGDDVATPGTVNPTGEADADEPGAHAMVAGATEPAGATDAAATGDDNLLGELARAMHAAATSQYQRLNAELERRRVEQVEAIAARAEGEIESLKADSETDIGSIELWAKGEIEKVKLERLRRIDARREELAGQLERHDTIKEREVFAIEIAIDAHRNEIDQFFGRMERETDPAGIASVAASMPPFPALDEVAADARRGALAEFAAIDRQEVTAPEEPMATMTSGVNAGPAATVQTAAAATEAAHAPAETVRASAEATDAAAEPTEAAEPRGAKPASAGATKATGSTAPAPESIAISPETRLKPVMDPAASRGEAETKPWEAPYAVSVAAGTSPAEEAPAPMSVGSTLLRTVRSIRPMARHDKDSSEGDSSR